MKKQLTLAALAVAMCSGNAIAQEEPDYKSWLGLSGMYYKSSGLHITDGVSHDDGYGASLEAGYRFTQAWATRAEISTLDIDYVGNNGSDDGEMTGVDLMYFMPDDLYYVFGGVRRHAIGDAEMFASFGMGKHWNQSERVKIITEIMTLRELDDNYSDIALKVGLAIPFGVKSAPAARAVTDYDTDNDGVVDRLDQCPMTPAGVAVDATGCPVEQDADKDGVPDSADMCPDTPMNIVVDDKGCTVFGNETVNITLRVLFDNNSTVVKEPRDPEIVQFAEFMEEYSDATAVIEGHTSAPGSATYNMTLSKERAEAFKAVLVDTYGIDAVRLETEGYGETRLLDSANTAQAHIVNRRISVTVETTVQVAKEK